MPAQRGNGTVISLANPTVQGIALVLMLHALPFNAERFSLQAHPAFHLAIPFSGIVAFFDLDSRPCIPVVRAHLLLNQFPKLFC
jgi:hypothetical protein